MFTDARKGINYSAKLKFRDVKGTIKSEDVDAVCQQQLNDDICAKKRVLFKKLPLGQRSQRHNDFGDFWEQTPAQSNKQRTQKQQTLNAKERRINKRRLIRSVVVA